MLDLSTEQITLVLAAVAVLVVPRLGTLKSGLSGLIGKFWPSREATTGGDIHDKVDAYRTLAGSLPPELAKSVWACIQEPAGEDEHDENE